MRTLRNIILRCVSDGLWFVDVIFIVFLTLSNFEVSFWNCFWRFKIEKCHFTRRFGGPFHQTLYLCTGEPWTRRAPFPAMDRVLFISVLEPYHAKDMFREILTHTVCLNHFVFCCFNNVLKVTFTKHHACAQEKPRQLGNILGHGQDSLPYLCWNLIC